MSQKLYIMCGPPGSGKTTWAKSHLNKEGNLYISRDEIRFSLLGDDTSEYFSKEKEVYREFIWRIYNGLKSGYNVIADATHLNEKSRFKLISRIPQDVLKEQNIIITAIYIKVPLNVCIERNNTRRKQKTYVPIDQLRRMYFSATEPTFKECNGKIDEIIIVNENGKIIKGLKKN